MGFDHGLEKFSPRSVLDELFELLVNLVDPDDVLVVIYLVRCHRLFIGQDDDVSNDAGIVHRPEIKFVDQCRFHIFVVRHQIYVVIEFRQPADADECNHHQHEHHDGKAKTQTETYSHVCD